MKKRQRTHSSNGKKKCLTLEIGISIFSLNVSIARVKSTMNTPKAAFSKSVNCTSQGRNSTRHPMLLFTGGSLNRIVCQLVLWMF